MGAIVQLQQESDVFQVDRVYGYAIMLPADEALKVSFDGIEKEIAKEKGRLKSMKSWTRIWETEDVRQMRRRIRLLEAIQMDIDIIRKMY